MSGNLQPGTRASDVDRAIEDEGQRMVYCHGCGEEMMADDAVWHGGEPYCDVCDEAAEEEL